MSDESNYKAKEPPKNPDDLPRYLGEELHRIENHLTVLAQRTAIQFIDATADASAAEVIVVDASANLVVVNLPGATSSLGVRYLVAKQKGANNVVIRSTETINGSGSSTLSAVYQQAFLFTDGIGWFQK